MQYPPPPPAPSDVDPATLAAYPLDAFLVDVPRLAHVPREAVCGAPNPLWRDIIPAETGGDGRDLDALASTLERPGWGLGPSETAIGENPGSVSSSPSVYPPLHGAVAHSLGTGTRWPSRPRFPPASGWDPTRPGPRPSSRPGSTACSVAGALNTPPPSASISSTRANAH